MREIQKNSNSIQNFSLFMSFLSDNTWHAHMDICSKILASLCSYKGGSQSCDHSIEIPLGGQRGAAGKRRRFIIQLAITLESLWDRIQQPNVFSPFILVHWLHREISGCNLHQFAAEQLVDFFFLFFGSGGPSSVKHQCDGHFTFTRVGAVEAAPIEMKKRASFKNWL